MLSDCYNDVTAGGGELELRDKLTGAIPQRHLPDNKRQPEDRGDKYLLAQQYTHTHTQRALYTANL